MPELPECETVVRTIRPYIWGCEIIGFMHKPDKKLTASKDMLVLAERVAGQKIHHVGRIGKYIYFKLDSGFIVSHLRMTGQWLFADHNQPSPNADKYFRWGLTIKDLDSKFSGFLWFRDPRKFGTIGWYERLEDCSGLASLGVDGLELSDYKNVLKIVSSAERSRRPIKNFLLDQTIIGGCGNIYACLDPRCNIYMADGSKKPITKITPGEKVISLNKKTGLIEPKEVLSVTPVERNNRDLYRIKPIGSIGALKCTQDHRVFTNVGWVEAQYLDPTVHKIAVPGLIPNYHLEQLIIGTSLGDSTIGTSKSGSRESKCLRLYQGEKQLDYLIFKRRCLGEVINGEPKKMARKSCYKTKNEKPVYQISTKYLPYFYTLWEDSKQKNGITDSILSKLDVEGLAYWYMDDGYSAKRPPRKTYAMLCCEGRTTEEANLASNRINALGYDTKVTKGYDGPVIRFSHSSSQKLFKDISRFVPEVMRYKLEGDVDKFNPPKYKWDLKVVFLPFAVKKYDFSIRTVWDLEVKDNHNFVSDNVLVHNCEALFETGISPFLPTYQLNQEEVVNLCLTLYDIFNRSIDLGGSSISDYSGGFYQEILRVYGRKGEDCYQCSYKIEKAMQAGRSTFYCPNCQGVLEDEFSE